MALVEIQLSVHVQAFTLISDLCIIDWSLEHGGGQIHSVGTLEKLAFDHCLIATNVEVQSFRDLSTQGLSGTLTSLATLC